MPGALTPLPVDEYVPLIREALRMHRAVIVVAAPGAGKTTRVPPALVDDGPVFVLQPRRVAARAIARRIADESGWVVGEEVGWHVRFDRRVSARTRLTVATEGILTGRLQQDPLLSDVKTIVLDEFHERSIHADVGLALAKQAWLARPDLRVVVMSATIDATKVAAYLHDCPIVDVPGRQFPLEVDYRPGATVGETVRRLRTSRPGTILCFLPGAREIERARASLDGLAAPVLPLHGGMSAEAQDAALAGDAEAGGGRVILATNLAETTLTVPGVTTVVDTGWHKVARYDASRGIDALLLERVPQDAADQRAGRAGRVRAGQVVRLWDARDRLRPHRDPEIQRVDLAGPLLDILAWGGNPETFEWFENPSATGVGAALELLRRLGAVDDQGRITSLGTALQRLPLHPRLARLFVDTDRTGRAARLCAALSAGADAATFDAAWDGSVLPDHLEAIVRQLKPASEVPGASGEERLRRAVLAAYPDRVARRRAPGSERCLLSSGVGAVVDRRVVGHDASDEFLVGVEVSRPAEAPGGPRRDPLIRIAVGIERDWLRPDAVEVQHVFDSDAAVVRAARIERYGALVLREHAVPPDAETAEALLVEAWLTRGPSEADAQILNRLAFARAGAAEGGASAPDLASLVRRAATGARRLADVQLARAMPPELGRVAPATLVVPSGRTVSLRYPDADTVVASVKLQEVFGLAETPRLGPRRVPVTFELLAPNGRPVQITRDLRSFWTRGYQDVRKELRGRYPKHPWPEDPWTAAPTHRTRRR